MKREYVESSVMTSYGYDSSISTLEIEFRSGDVWQYFEVPESVYYEMKSASSYGKFFQANIKGQYAEKQVG